MSLKAWVTIGIVVGSTVGSYVPVLWSQSFLSMASVLGSFIGGIVGIWAGYRAGQFFA